MRASDYLYCPGCGKKGVTMRLGREDHYGCRYCDWYAFAGSPDRVDLDRIEALRAKNGGRRDL